MKNEFNDLIGRWHGFTNVRVEIRRWSTDPWKWNYTPVTSQRGELSCFPTIGRIQLDDITSWEKVVHVYR